jgi:MFS-type transporter involved in bile tolerance (Atg22 family)
VAIAFWMVGFPAKAFGFYMLVQYATAQTAEASLSLTSKFTDNAAYAVVACQVCVCITATICTCMYCINYHQLYSVIPSVVVVLVSNSMCRTHSF